MAPSISNYMIGQVRFMSHENRDPLDTLPVSHEAEFDSFADQHEDECLQGTRAELLNEIKEWVESSQGKCIFWLSGAAGTGKSTIARTVARLLSHEKLLGASFFFKRGEGDRGNAMKFITTVTRRIGREIPDLTLIIQKAVRDDPDIATRSLRHQFDSLLLQPILELKQSSHHIPTMVLVIDALDECDPDDNVEVILQLLPQLRQAVNVRIFLTSRPELPIRLGFREMSDHDYQNITLHQISESLISRDISLYFNHRLLKTRKIQELSNDWPGLANIQVLVALSVPLFIFAATLCRMFDDPFWDPVDSLTEILTYRGGGSQLEGTYVPVLNRLLKGQNQTQKDQLVLEYRKILGIIVILESPLAITPLSKLTNLPRRLIVMRLKLLHSVINVPTDNNSPVRLFHLSFRDVLLHPAIQGKTPFWMDEKGLHQGATTRCLSLCQDLKRNLCGLPSEGTQRSEIDQQTIDRCIPPELRYACHYWARHLVQSEAPAKNMEIAFVFLQNHFLHWLEAMAIMGLISEVVGILDLLQSVQHVNDQELSDFLHDAKRFILKFRFIADEAPLQIYSSGILFSPRKMIIRNYLREGHANWNFRPSDLEESWNEDLQTLEGHSFGVQCVSFSPDGRLIASGAYDKTIKLWNTATGELQQTLRGHLDGISSLVFCPDGRHLVSGSYDRTVRLWNTSTGATEQNYEDHSDGVTYVALCPNGRVLASTSFDKTIRLRDIQTGAPIQPVLKGHSRSVFSLSFSPDGLSLASSSRDKTIRIWDISRGVLQLTLRAHSALVMSVAFSPDGQILASGSDDKTIRLWDPTTGALLQTFEDPAEVYSVVFSLDGRLLASGSGDKTLKVRDSSTGTLKRTFKQHSGLVRSVAFSPDLKILASGSYDQTARLWDLTTCTSPQTTKGHSDWVWSIMFSPDHRKLASCSWDRTIKIWDLTTGDSQQTLRGHSDAVLAIAFSSESHYLASASRDETIIIWDIVTSTPRLRVKGHLDPVYCLTFSPDDKLLASGSSDNTVRMWSSTTGALLKTLRGHSSSIHCVAFSPKAQVLASGSSDNTVILWEVSTGSLIHTLEGHSTTVVSVTFSPCGRLLASSSNGGTLIIWQITTTTHKHMWRFEKAVHQLEFSDDGSYLRTNIGSISLQNLDFGSETPHLKAEIISVFEDTWIALNGERTLWLPHEFRPVCSATQGDLLAMGHASGRISLLEPYLGY
ncbi:NACHT and WD40 domain protein [Penicillium taxi]|uniref:NACHT and WD40 domain protein n=1 Tax=Penicillium taxi TaxID=168475 RepID=UPI002544DA1A|nr:NACHT and WD40 domain protein [Penicillium taxi]KAJ5894617.1 NACHT and WD40 domain protein [Penicillium taxi]